jgi:hypothetical protein
MCNPLLPLHMENLHTNKHIHHRNINLIIIISFVGIPGFSEFMENRKFSRYRNRNGTKEFEVIIIIIIIIIVITLIALLYCILDVLAKFISRQY